MHQFSAAICADCIAAGKWGAARLPTAVRQGAVPAIAIAIMVAYSARTVARNFDWANEGTLFRAALKVIQDRRRLAFEMSAALLAADIHCSLQIQCRLHCTCNMSNCSPEHCIPIAQVCPGSAKVQLNNGILERRSANWTGALTFFERARQIEPSYCEADFWTGLTLLNANRQVVPGRHPCWMQRARGCSAPHPH